MTLSELLALRESEHRIEFKEGKTQFSYKGGDASEPGKRRRCVLGYVVALANEGGGILAFGVREALGQAPHVVVGSIVWEDQEGQLAADIYRDKGIRVETEVLRDAAGRRVLLLHIDRRPVGRFYTFEDLPLMRVGDRLEPMDEVRQRRILHEIESDFSAEPCLGLTLDDLDPQAVAELKNRYADKQKNPGFRLLTDQHALSDLFLLTDTGQLTYAALLLVGKASCLRQRLPQAGLNLEYRPTLSSIPYQDRRQLLEPLFGGLDAAWAFINQRNGYIPIRQGLYVRDDIPLLNEVVVREALLNAVAHRDYRRQAEIVVRQFPNRLDVSSPGGLPPGVTLANLITVNSTPRNRLLAEVLLKTGLVERSGQGVDKIFYFSILEAKGLPSYARSDDAQVVLELPALVADPAFALFIHHVQQELHLELSLDEVLTLEQVRQRVPRVELPVAAVQQLLAKNLLEAVGNTRARHFILSREYYQFVGQSAAYTQQVAPDEMICIQQILRHLGLFPERSQRMADLQALFHSTLTSHQVKEMVYRFRDRGWLAANGRGRATTYGEGQTWRAYTSHLNQALNIGLAQMQAWEEHPTPPPFGGSGLTTANNEPPF